MRTLYPMLVAGVITLASAGPHAGPHAGLLRAAHQPPPPFDPSRPSGSSRVPSRDGKLRAAPSTVEGPQQPPAQPPPTAQQQPVFRAATDVVAVDASVIDNDGRPIRGLTPDDFTVTVDGTPRRLVSAQFVSQSISPSATSDQYSSNEEMIGGRVIVLLIDQGNISRGDGRPVLHAAGKFLSTLNPSDRIGFAVIPGAVGRLNFTARQHALVQERLSRVSGLASRDRSYNMGISEAMAVETRHDQLAFDEMYERQCSRYSGLDQRQYCERQLHEDARSLVQSVMQQTNASLTALRGIFMQLEKIEGPKTVILISEGLVIDRDLGAISWVSSAAAAARATLFAIQLEPGLFDASRGSISPTSIADRHLQTEGLAQLATLARGTVFTVGANADTTFGRLALELTGYYLLGFEPLPGDRDGKTHQIKVEVRRRGVTVRTRREFAVGDAAIAKNRKDEDALADALQSPLLATDLRVKLTAYTYEDPPTGRIKLLVAANINPAIDDAGITGVGMTVANDEGRIVTSSFDPEPAVSVDNHQTRLYLGAAVVDPGAYVLKFAVRDRQGRIGSVEHAVKARLTSAGQLHVGDLLLSAPPPPGESSGPALRPAVDPALQTSDVVGYLELYSKIPEQLDRARVQIEVASDPNAKALVAATATVSATKHPQRRIVEGRVDLALLPPGPYIARAVVSVGDRPVARVTRPFYFPAAAAASHVKTAESPAGRPRANVGAGLRPAATSMAAAGAFQRTDVLQPDVLGAFLDRLAKLERGTTAPAGTAGTEADPTHGGTGVPALPSGASVPALPSGASVPAVPSGAGVPAGGSAISAAIDHARAGRFDQVLDAVQRLKDDRAGVPFLRGLARFARGEFEAAAAGFRESLRLSADFQPAVFYLGACYAAGGFDSQAIGAWQTALVSESDVPIVAALLSDALLRTGDPDEAIAVLHEARRTFSNDDRFASRLAMAYIAAGKPADALATLDPYLVRHPDEADALFLALRVIFEAHAAGKPIASAAEDLQRFEKYARAYAAANGPQQQLVSQWQRFLAKP